MPVYVRVRNGRVLRERVEASGSHADVAMRAGLSPARLSQLLSGVAPVINLEQAARLESVLDVPPGTFFAVDAPGADAGLISAYLDAQVPPQAAPADSADDRCVPIDGGEC